MFIRRKGLDGQVTPHDSATRDAAFTGTAITIEGEDTCCTNLLVLGFNYVWVCDSHQRAEASNIRWDAKNGFWSINSLDVSRIKPLHGWPFVTFGTLGNAASTAEHMNHRPGIAYRFSGVNDWIQLEDLFEYGHFIGIQTETAEYDAPGSTPAYPYGPSNAVFTNCGKDSLAYPVTPWVIPGSIGFKILGKTNELKLIGCQTAAVDVAYHIELDDGEAQVIMVACSAHGVRTGLKVDGGNVRMSACWLRGLNGHYGETILEGAGISLVGGSASRVIVDRTTDIRGFQYAVNGASIPGAIIGMPHITSGTVINLGLAEMVITGIGTAQPSPNHDQQSVSGPPGQALGTLGATYPGHTIQFYFNDTRSVLSSGNIRLNGGFDLVVNDRDVLTLQSADSFWVEVCRGQAT